MKHTWENAAFSCGTERGMGIVWKYNPLINNIEARKNTHTRWSYTVVASQSSINRFMIYSVIKLYLFIPKKIEVKIRCYWMGNTFNIWAGRIKAIQYSVLVKWATCRKRAGCVKSRRSSWYARWIGLHGLTLATFYDGVILISHFSWWKAYKESQPENYHQPFRFPCYGLCPVFMMENGFAVAYTAYDSNYSEK